MRAQNRSMQAAPQPGLCACLHLAARLQLLLELSHLHGHQVLLHRLHRRRCEQLLAQARRTQLRPARSATGRRDREGARARPIALGGNHTPAEAGQRHKHRAGDARVHNPPAVARAVAAKGRRSRPPRRRSLLTSWLPSTQGAASLRPRRATPVRAPAPTQTRWRSWARRHERSATPSCEARPSL